MSPQITSVYNKNGTQWKYVGAVALPLFFLGLSVYGLALHGWKVFFATFPFAVVCTPFVWAILADKKRSERSKIEVYSNSEEIHFSSFSFVSQFLPEPVREKEVLKFSDLIDAQTREANGVRSLHLRTIKGRLVISEQMTQFDELIQLFESIVELNQENEEKYEASIQTEPQVKTAWYGWVILASAIAIVLYLGWKFMYA